eukprot:scaffold113_cov339-Pavlova_lutheri.AAC.37
MQCHSSNEKRIGIPTANPKALPANTTYQAVCVLNPHSQSVQSLFVRYQHFYTMPRVTQKPTKVPHALRAFWLGIARRIHRPADHSDLPCPTTKLGIRRVRIGLCFWEEMFLHICHVQGRCPECPGPVLVVRCLWAWKQIRLLPRLPAVDGDIYPLDGTTTPAKRESLQLQFLIPLRNCGAW